MIGSIIIHGTAASRICPNMSIPINKAVLRKLIRVILTAAYSYMKYITCFFRGNFSGNRYARQQFKAKLVAVFNISMIVSVYQRKPLQTVTV